MKDSHHVENVKFNQPQIQVSEYRLTLVTDVDGLTMPISVPAHISPLVAEKGGPVTLRLLPLSEDVLRKVALDDLYLRLDGSFNARFEKAQLLFSVTAIKEALKKYANDLASKAPGKARRLWCTCLTHLKAGTPAVLQV
jgi:hypothetical protein